MRFKHARHQKLEQSGRPENGKGEPQANPGRDEACLASHTTGSSGHQGLLEQVLARENITRAWKRVKANHGSAGTDGRTIEQTANYLREQWPTIRRALLDGQYSPQPVRRVDIPKPEGGTRQLGIPTVVDRLIQQALLQVLQPIVDPTFSEFSYGFRPNRSAHDAVKQAKKWVEDGHRIVVDVDLEKFFDQVNHDIFMDRVSKKIGDKAVLRLIRRYLQAGIMENGVATLRERGTPQGGPLSPLLANMLLDEVDRELERRGHRFVRYADDCNIYVRSKRAGERVLSSMRKVYQRLHLQVNETKTAVAEVFGRKFLGYCVRRWSNNGVKLSISKQAQNAFRQKVKEITRRVGGKGMRQVAEQLRSFIPGWKNYFSLSETSAPFQTLDSWTRRRLRAIQLKMWRRGTTIYRESRRLGANHSTALKIASIGGRWWYGSRTCANVIFSTQYFDKLGIPRLS